MLSNNKKKNIECMSNHNVTNKVSKDRFDEQKENNLNSLYRYSIHV